MLDEIIKNNNELSKYSSIIPDLKRIEAFIPNSARENFYRNLKTLEIEETLETKTAKYLCDKNKILINTSNKDDKIIAYELCHELLHMASNKYDIYSGLAMTGFSFSLGVDGKFLFKNKYLNEGFTEAFNLLFYPEFMSITGYSEEVAIASILGNILGIDNVKTLYFKSSLAQGLGDLLAAYLNKEMIKVLFNAIEVNARNRLGIVNEKRNSIDIICNILMIAIRKSFTNFLNNGLDYNDVKTYYDTSIKGNMYYLISKLPENEQIIFKNNIDSMLDKIVQSFDNYGRGYINLYYLIFLLGIISLGIFLAWFMI